MSRHLLILRYSVFAVIATLLNLGVQRAILLNGTTSINLAVALLVGTGVGLAVKYILDKRWIFNDQTKGLKSQGAMFFFYSLTGVFTTAIFWVSEAGFWYIWQSDVMRELGAIIGLTIGYITKFHLDSRFVFTTSTNEART